MATSLKESTGRVLASLETVKKESLVAIQQTLSLPTGANQLYNVATALGAEAEQYDLSSIDVEVYCVDNQAGSPTNGYYIRADAVVAIGFKVTGEVLIRNLHIQTLTVLVRISVKKKAA